MASPRSPGSKWMSLARSRTPSAIVASPKTGPGASPHALGRPPRPFPPVEPLRQRAGERVLELHLAPGDEPQGALGVVVERVGRRDSDRLVGGAERQDRK